MEGILDIERKHGSNQPPFPIDKILDPFLGSWADLKFQQWKRTFSLFLTHPLGQNKSSIHNTRQKSVHWGAVDKEGNSVLIFLSSTTAFLLWDNRGWHRVW